MKEGGRDGMFFLRKGGYSGIPAGCELRSSGLRKYVCIRALCVTGKVGILSEAVKGEVYF